MVSVAIDGPAGAGKSTLSKILSKKLGFVYFDTGALYRAIAYYFIENQINYEDPEILAKNLDKIQVSFDFENGVQRMFLSGVEVTDKIRNDEVSEVASFVSAHSKVREFLLGIQRDVAEKNNVVMDGRDVGTVILPNADVKIFLTADLKVRADRRFKQFIRNNSGIKYENVLESIKKRDKNDTNREIAPLVPASDAIVLDTSYMSLDETVDRLVNIVKERINEQ